MEQRLTIRFTKQQWRRLMYLERLTRRSKGAVVRLLLDAAVPTGHRELDVDTRKWERGPNIMEAKDDGAL